MYVIADDIDWENHKLINPGKLHNLDHGFDVYATQAFNAPDGNAYEVSWVGLPDTTYPTDDENWANCLSQVKELHLKSDKLIQTPVKAISSIRKNEASISNQVVSDQAGQQFELELTIKANQSGTLHLAANNDLSNSLQLNFDTKNGKLVLDRAHAGQKVAVDYGESRAITLSPNHDLKLDIFVDHSLIEVFVNDGEKVLTGRYFADQTNKKIAFAQDIDYTGKLWQMQTIL
jgi:beta-fructofuranosidase